ncbi:glyoxalase [Veronia nyctiphanis]|uniref:Glyoxalase n=1 Tax=Veronia nyctiphanis TaxID=1278244 RepID=A0A4Q0YSJ0_9GAMM|nr:VOC family protein [Veronia nyctiphanis]RXJ74172.1 glyoxalase [Veronia nyctiphanis]
MFKKIESTMFFADDIHKAAKWYAELLGSEVEYENPDYAFVRGAEMIFGFHPVDEKNNPGRDGSVTYWEIDDITSAISTLTSMGATLYRGPGKTDLGADVAMLIDPFGNAIGLNQSPTPNAV